MFLNEKTTNYSDFYNAIQEVKNIEYMKKQLAEFKTKLKQNNYKL